ncbi:DMT family transporter [Brevibacillus dissolubilis]|uniref:DMT family transporter n=1 Tax=Brevibacillus dissolubilis TaxID=1844116 RepID=UPI0021001F60|nr:DMT family transporter [Brevibacillus dissolubilis]
MNVNPYYFGVLLVALSATGFGIMPIFAKFAYQGGADVTTLLCLRFALAGLLFFIYLKSKRANLHVSRKHLLALFLLGGVGYTLQSISYFTAVKFIPASLVALLLYTFPIFVTILAFLLDREKLTKKVIGAIFLSILGLMLVMGTNFGELNMIGILYACAAAVVYAGYVFFSNRVLQQVQPMVASLYISAFAALTLVMMGMSTDSLQLGFEWKAWAALIGIVLISTMMSMLTLFQGMKLVGSTRASVISMIEPLLTIGFSAMLFGERLTMIQGLGVAAVLAGAMIVVGLQGQKSQESVGG